jgi:drug/metabolite transporter (DMT)-like permease
LNSLKVLVLTTIALIAFAANSVLCRLALESGQIDAASFTSIRLVSGVISLFILMLAVPNKGAPVSKGTWGSGFMLFVYAVTFSYAYLILDTATGALILFGAVQITIILASLVKGNRLHFSEWLGTFIAFAGFVYLVLPGLTTPSVSGFILMAVSGIAWGIYTLFGKYSINPIQDTAYNFLKAIPFVAILLALSLPSIELAAKGVFLAVASGALASGVGYTIWYMVLRHISATVAAVVQLLVPVLASFGGVLFVSEEITNRLLLSGVFILGGIFIVIISRQYFAALGRKNGT